MSAPLVPDDAPFNEAQRAWLNGFLTAVLAARGPAVAAPSAVAQPAESSNGARSSTPSVAATPAAAPVVQAPAASAETQLESQSGAVAVADDEDEADSGDFPWHDPALEMDDRMSLAEGRKPERQLMAAMAQLDCGSCGYLCQTYAEAIASGVDSDITKCSPGGRETTKKLKELVTTLRIGETTVSVAGRSAERSDVAVNTEFNDGSYNARLLRTLRLNGEGSEKDVRHIEIDLRSTPLTYKVGDALGVTPENCSDAVSDVLDVLGATGAEDVPAHNGGSLTTSLREALLHQRMISKMTPDLIEFLADVATNPQDAGRLLNMLVDETGAPLEGVELIDILQQNPSARPSPAELVDNLPLLRPRLYSISSSPLAHPGQVHLTVGVVRFKNRHERQCKGVASSFLAERVRPGQKIRVHVHASLKFGLPPDLERDIIMVGPGTGIAPFRAFLEERKVLNAPGRNWLFFGDQREQTDFLYKDELLAFQSDGVLSRLDTAFSRDTAKKVYVQHRMRENAAELWNWLESGASFYVCGDAKRMAKDVDLALKQIVAEQGKMPKADAEAYVAQMTKDGRYQRDVY
ncbi:MAG TPA: sulfite reductase subunit alpha [Tepidisphaeraceae bacterium]|nr:sulfite reductase subunit alpha [Tepidisphaeraceae bacterium]